MSTSFWSSRYQILALVGSVYLPWLLVVIDFNQSTWANFESGLFRKALGIAFVLLWSSALLNCVVLFRRIGRAMAQSVSRQGEVEKVLETAYHWGAGQLVVLSVFLVIHAAYDRTCR